VIFYELTVIEYLEFINYISQSATRVYIKIKLYITINTSDMTALKFDFI